MIKIVLTGSESTGKTALARELGQRFAAPVSEEFVRGYAAQRGSRLSFTDHGPIARGQIANEDAAISGAADLVFLDTDLISTVVYCEHYFGRCPQWIFDTARARAATLYLLMRPDIPWVPDGVRDRGERREEMHRLFTSTLTELRLPFIEIGGSWEERLERAVRAVYAVRASGDDPRRGSASRQSRGVHVHPGNATPEQHPHPKQQEDAD